MTFQIKKVILYPEGKFEKREIEFNENSINFIVGNSSTGKSAIIDIIDYCLGTRYCNIAFGPIRDTVKAYGLLINNQGKDIFICREKPKKDYGTSSNVYLDKTGNVPEDISNIVFDLNTNDFIKILLNFIDGFDGINLLSHGEEKPASITFSHMRHYLYQRQDVIASSQMLFLNSSTFYEFNDVKNALLYFLRIKTNKYFILNNRREELKKEIKILIRKIRDMKNEKSQFFERGTYLLKKAKNFLININDDIDEESLLKGELEKIVNAKLDFYESQNFDTKELIQEKTYLRNELMVKKDRIEEIQDYLESADSFHNTLINQKDKLSEMNFENDLIKCPVCSKEMELHGDLYLKEFQKIEKDLNSIPRDTLTLNSELENLKKEEKILLTKIKKISENIEELEIKNQELKKNSDSEKMFYELKGECSFFIKYYIQKNEQSDLEKDLDVLKTEFNETENKINEENLKDEDSVFSEIGSKITSLISKIKIDGLEYAKDLYFFDKENLDIYVKRGEQKIRLSQMGSGQNWLITHLISILGLREYMLENGCYAPSFLVLDQLSQVYYPREDGKVIEDEDVKRIIKENNEKSSGSNKQKDVESLEKIYKFLFNYIKENMNSNFQLIIFEHAKLKEVPGYIESVREEWTEKTNKKLIPDEWIVNSNLSQTSS